MDCLSQLIVPSAVSSSLEYQMDVKFKFVQLIFIEMHCVQLVQEPQYSGITLQYNDRWCLGASYRQVINSHGAG